MLAATERCGSRGSLALVTPALLVDLGAPAGSPVAADTIAGIVGGLPKGRVVFLHLRVTAGERTAAARAQESAIEQRVAQLVAALPLASDRVSGAILEIDPSPGDMGLLQFGLATLVLQSKAIRATLPITIVFPPGMVRQAADLSRRVTVYADAIGVGDGAQWRLDAEWARDQLQKPVVLKVTPGPGPASAASRYLDVVVETGDSLVDSVWVEPAAADQAVALCRAAGVLSSSIGSGFAGSQKVPVTLRGEGDPVSSSAFIDSRSPDVAFVVRAGGSRESPRRVTVAAELTGAFEVTCLDALDGRRQTVGQAGVEGQARTRDCTVDSAYALVVVKRGEADQRVYESVDVTGRGGLRVEEIIARWQQYREAQKRVIDNYMAQCLLSLHFESTTIGSGFDVSLQLRQFVDRTGLNDWVQEAFFVNGVRYTKKGGFPLPQLEPEKVVTQPLSLTLEERYRYTLIGTETVDGTLCFVVGVEPEDPAAMLYSGKVWIDGVTFRQVRMQLQQRGGRSSVLSHVETQDFALVPGGSGPELNLLRSIYVQADRQRCRTQLHRREDLRLLRIPRQRPRLRADPGGGARLGPAYVPRDRRGVAHLEARGPGENRREALEPDPLAAGRHVVRGDLRLPGPAGRVEHGGLRPAKDRRAVVGLLRRPDRRRQPVQAGHADVPLRLRCGALGPLAEQPRLRRRPRRHRPEPLEHGADNRRPGELAGPARPEPHGLFVPVAERLPPDRGHRRGLRVTGLGAHPPDDGRGQVRTAGIRLHGDGEPEHARGLGRLRLSGARREGPEEDVPEVLGRVRRSSSS